MTEPVVNLELALSHGLSCEEYQKVIEKLGRIPSFTELGIVSVMWSEHACYKNSIKYIKRLPKDSPNMLAKAGEENAGVIDIGDNLAICFKIESHNHPSAISPFHGAATGVGGILRDIFTMGARPICCLNSLRFGNPEDPKVKSTMKGVIEGIAHYGNCFGVPTVGGEIYFEDCYKGNPLVNAMAVGLMEHKNLMTASATGPGNFVLIVGGKTGRDGIHGTTFASEELNEKSEDHRASVAIGDPFMQKLLLEATMEVIERKLIIGIQDMGAAGLTCSSSEMSAKAGTGIEIDTALVPVREENMSAYEILLSESQERMLLIVTPGNYNHVVEIFNKWDLNIAKIGHVTEDKMFRVRHNGILKAEIPSNFLVLGGEAPVYDRAVEFPAYLLNKRNYNPDDMKHPECYNQVLKDLLASPNIASKKSVYTQYDHMIQTNTVIEPGSDAAVIRIKNTNKAIAVAVDCNGRHCYLDPYIGAMSAVAEAARNVICTGATPIAITNNLNFGNPYKPEVYWTFVETIKGIEKACNVFGTPVTGGNVSFNNERSGLAIYPTPTIGMLGLLDDVNNAITTEFKNIEDYIYLLGSNSNEIGGSEYQKLILNDTMGYPPLCDLDLELTLQKTMIHLTKEKVLQSAHDCSDGGLAVAIAEKCFKKDGNVLGCEINLDFKGRPDFELFGESHARIIVSIKPSDTLKFENICSMYNQKFCKIGRVFGDKLRVNNLLNSDLYELRRVYEKL